MTTLPQDLQELLARCLDGGTAGDWQALHEKLAAVRDDAGILDAYTETCALHHDLRCVLAPGASNEAFLRGVESKLNDQRKDSGQFVLEVAARTGEQFKKRDRTGRSRFSAWAGWGAAAMVLLAAGLYFLHGSASTRSIGRILRDGSAAQLARGGAEHSVSAGESLFADDILRTGSGADGSEIELDEKATFHVSADTVVTFRKDQPYALELKQGKLDISVGPHPKDHPFIVRTPHADAEVLGTHFALEVDTDRTRLDVFESRVRLKSVADSNSNAIVQAGYSAEARSGSPIVAISTKDMPLVAVFQQGKNGYAGARDVVITTQNSEFTYNNGATQFDADQYLICNFKEYQMRMLMRFDGLTLPARAKVVSAELDMKWENWDTGQSLQGSYLNVAWNPKARDLNGLGWIHRDVGADWAMPGAGDDKKDRVPGITLPLPTPGNAYVTSTRISLDPLQVQRWVGAPASNFGVLFSIVKRSDHIRAFASHAAEQNNRPSLIIRYTLPDDNSATRK